MKTVTSAQWSNEIGNASDADYHAYLERVKARFIQNVGSGPVFTTDAPDMWDTYLNTFHGEYRQHHDCHACRNFIQRFGNLATIDVHGNVTSAVWHTDDAPEHYRAAVEAMARLVCNAKVTGVFYSSDKVWGQPKTGQWRHLSVTPPKAMVHTDRLLDAHQAMAAKRHDYETLERALICFSMEHLTLALEVVSSDALYRNEKVKGVVEFLFNLKMAMNSTPRQKRHAGLWLSVATAPTGYCHPRSSMVGTLLEDIEAGLPIGDIQRKFAAKMHPLKYQRPQAAPSAGNIAAAEKIVERLGIAASLKRRFARLEDIVAVWKPTEASAEDTRGGVFGHLKAKGEHLAHRSMDGLQNNVMTWVKFRDTVLPDALEIQVHVPLSGNFIGMTTAVDPDAPPILQWDHPEKRYPVGWYVYTGGSTAAMWGLRGNCFHRVTALTLNPAHANDVAGAAHYKPGVVAIIEGAADRTVPNLCIFPETLKSELHSIRSTIEAYSKGGQLEGQEEATACGLYGPQLLLRVRTRSVETTYKIDRWD